MIVPLTAMMLAALAPRVVPALDQFTYSDAKGNLKVAAHSGRATQLANAQYELTLQSGVSIRSQSQGLSLDADQVQCDLAKTSTKDSRSEVRHATATGRVDMTKTLAPSPDRPKRATEITASKAVLDAVSEGDVVHLAGPVRIQSGDAGKPSTMVVTGSSGVATLASDAKDPNNALRAATLQGPVRITLLMAPSSVVKAGSHVVATGDRVEISNSGPKPTVVLMGHVEVHGDSIGDFRGIDRATMKLDGAMNVVDWEVGS